MMSDSAHDMAPVSSEGRMIHPACASPSACVSARRLSSWETDLPHEVLELMPSFCTQRTSLKWVKTSARDLLQSV